ncbi:MAG: flavin reductase [Acutalibacteraceae bacterium]|nr:flavin reductase [Acutalibacteraceae bacterium]
MSFKSIDIKDFNENIFKIISEEWMLVTSGSKEKFNTMTASWGFAGFMWRKPVVNIVIRPQRYTREFLDSNEYFTLSFYGENKSIHSVCGSKSGREVDKVKECGLTPIFDNNSVYFDEARLVIVCKKMYVQQMSEDCVIDESIKQNYNNDYHISYIGEITDILVKE